MENSQNPGVGLGVFGAQFSTTSPTTTAASSPNANPFAVAHINPPSFSSLGNSAAENTSTFATPANIFGSTTSQSFKCGEQAQSTFQPPKDQLQFTTRQSPVKSSKTYPQKQFPGSGPLFVKPAFSLAARAEKPASGLYGMPASLPLPSSKPPRLAWPSTTSESKFKGNLTWVRPTTSGTTSSTETTIVSSSIFGTSQFPMQSNPPRFQLAPELAHSLADGKSSKESIAFTFGIPQISTQASLIPNETVFAPVTLPKPENKPLIATMGSKPGISNIFAKAITEVADRDAPKPRLRRLSVKKTTTTSPTKKSLPTPEEIKTFKIIICQHVPPEYNASKTLRDHFEQFGKVLRVFPYVPKAQATIFFETHEEAERAKNEGAVIKPGVALKIYWKKSPSQVTKPKDVKKTGLGPGGTDIGDSLVEDELKAMRGSLAEPLKRERKTTRSLVTAAMALPAKKLTITEGLPPRSVSPAKDLPSTTDIANLQSMLRQQALTPVARSDLLDARDKLVRLLREKPKGGSSKKNLLGTCPDMCPEKERYSREEKRRLASYELLYADKEKEYGVNHKTAVKEYSRSSADQEEPLSHELRPGPVLTITMDYIVSCILDKSERPEENLAEWYHFVWDRTRGIRKDITQQNLCDLEGVSLVEKCARFHIHCTARLCEMDAQFFDQKINDENLTKCMQTLKHLYYDLSLKNVICPNEAEFRAYDVLLHLNEGDILREVQQFSPVIRESTEVGSALKFFAALNNRNYIRFFRLALENMNYLQCCILQRYLAQIRGKSLEIISRAYCPSSKVMPYPLSSVIKQLGFENPEEAATFCRNHNLAVDEEADTLYLDKNAFTYPDFQIPLLRSSRLIESKRIKTVGEVVQKGPMPVDPTVNHVPHNSFDENGYLKKDAWNAEDQKPGYIFVPVAVPMNVPSVPEVIQKPMISEAVLRRVAMEVLGGVVDQFAAELVQEIRDARNQAYVRLKAMDGLVNDMVDSLTSAIASNVHHEAVQGRLKEQREAEAQRMRLLSFRDREAATILTTLIATLTQEELRHIAQTELSVMRAEMDRRQSRITDRVNRELLLEFVQEECRLLASNEIRAWKQDRLEKVAFMQAKISKRRAIWVYRVWRKFCQSKQHLRLMVSTFPAFHSTSTWKEQSALWRSAGESPPTKRLGILELSQSSKLLRKLTAMETCCTTLGDTITAQTLDIQDIVRDAVLTSCQAVVQWKLVCINDNASALIVDIQDLLSLRDFKKDSKGWVSKGHVVYENGRVLQYCVQCVEDKTEWEKSLRGANSVILISDASSCQNLIQRARLLAPNLSNLPFAVLTSNEDLGMEADANVRFYVTDWSLRPHALIQLEKSLGWLFANKTPSIPLGIKFNHLPYIVEDFLYHHVTSVWFAGLARRKEAGFLHPSPDLLISLANAAIRHLANALQNSNLQHVYWPPVEFGENLDWNSKLFQKQICQAVLKSLSLPKCELHQCESWADVCDQVWNYVNDVKVDSDATGFYSRVSSLIQQTENNFQVLVWRENKAKRPQFLPQEDIWSDLKPEPELFPWTDLIQACLEYRIQSLKLWSKVGVLQKELGEFQWPRDWKKACAFATRKSQVSLNESLANALKRKSDSNTSENRNRKSLRVTPRTKLEEDILNQSMEVLEEARQLRESEAEFEAKLSSWLQNGDTDTDPLVRQHARVGEPASPYADTERIGTKQTLQNLKRQLSDDREDSRHFERYLEGVMKDV